MKRQGIELSRRFYEDAVAPLLSSVPHGAALVGPGSEVLGFDTERSHDHDWGAFVVVFVEVGRARPRLPDFPGVRGVALTDVVEWSAGWLGFQPLDGVGLLDWLATPTQRLAEVTGGAVFHDGLGVLTPLRAALEWYPVDVWRYVLGCQWRRIAQEEAFVGRCREVGDETGARVVEARLTRDLMRLRLLMRRSWPPYSKWLGSAATWDSDLLDGYVSSGEECNALGLAPPVEATIRPYYERPYSVLGADRFADALWAAIEDPAVRALPHIGAIDQFVDNTDLVGEMSRCRAVTAAALGLDPGSGAGRRSGT